jgi:hypothetical protein
MQKPTKPKQSILKRLTGLVPDVDAIARAYGVDQKRAKKIQVGLGSLLEFLGDLILEQAEFIEGQTETANLIDREIGRERDARTIFSNIDVFLSGDAATAEHILSIMFVPIFAQAFSKLEPERQRELFAALREAINSLKRQDGILV